MAILAQAPHLACLSARMRTTKMDTNGHATKTSGRRQAWSGSMTPVCILGSPNLHTVNRYAPGLWVYKLHSLLKD